MGFEINGLDELKQEMLSMVNEKFPVEKEKEMKKLALMATSQIKPLIPVDQGRLRNSLSFAFGSTTSEPFDGKSEGTILPIDPNTIEATTNVFYASWVNDGHLVNSRFVPGYWEGNKFVYVENAKEKGIKTGMKLHPQYILGKHYMERGLQNAEPQIIAEIDRWLNELMGKV